MNQQTSPPEEWLAEWLDTLETERDALIMKLRQLERTLQRHGRLREGLVLKKPRPR